MATETKKIAGKVLVRAYTLNTMYANGNIELQDKAGNIYRVSVDVLLELLKREKFTATMKRKYFHLELA